MSPWVQVSAAELSPAFCEEAQAGLSVSSPQDGRWMADLSLDAPVVSQQLGSHP